MEEDYYKLQIGDVVQITTDGSGFVEEDIGKHVEVVGFGGYFDDDGVDVVAYDCILETEDHGDDGVVGLESFGDNPMVLFNTKKVPEYVSPQYLEVEEQDYGKHYRYSFRLNLTSEEAKRGYVIVNIDPYRISEVYELGGWREHLVKKAIRGTEKGHTEDELIEELQCTLDRAKQMREESREDIGS